MASFCYFLSHNSAKKREEQFTTYETGSVPYILGGRVARVLRQIFFQTHESSQLLPFEYVIMTDFSWQTYRLFCKRFGLHSEALMAAPARCSGATALQTSRNTFSIPFLKTRTLRTLRVISMKRNSVSIESTRLNAKLKIILHRESSYHIEVQQTARALTISGITSFQILSCDSPIS